jgi:glucose-1-phosphate cytidylyltransferase
MRVGILAGGLGSRLAEETDVRPKPMVEIGGRPILWHIMRYYAHFGFTDFAVALGYKAGFALDWFAAHPELTEGWCVDLVDTGEDTNTGGRIKRLRPLLTGGPSGVDGETCMVTWGDGVGTVDLDALLAFHRAHGRLATLTAVRPPIRFGHLEMEGDRVVEFSEKPPASEGWINGAFFVFEPGVFDYIAGDDTQFEKEPLERLAQDGELMAFRHEGFWQCMDTIRDRRYLEELWAEDPPWRVWD